MLGRTAAEEEFCDLFAGERGLDILLLQAVRYEKFCRWSMMFWRSVGYCCTWQKSRDIELDLECCEKGAPQDWETRSYREERRRREEERREEEEAQEEERLEEDMESAVSSEVSMNGADPPPSYESLREVFEEGRKRNGNSGGRRLSEDDGVFGGSFTQE